MENLYIEPGVYTPEVIMQTENNTFRISGNSYPESPEKFYQPVLDWARNYFSSSNSRVELPMQFKFNYFNTSTSKLLAQLFRIIESSPINEKVIIYWYHEEYDIDMLNSGHMFDSLFKIKFIFKVN